MYLLKIEHKQDVVLTHFISNFVVKRMRQYALHTNKNKYNAKKKVYKISSHIMLQ